MRPIVLIVLVAIIAAVAYFVYSISSPVEGDKESAGNLCIPEGGGTSDPSSCCTKLSAIDCNRPYGTECSTNCSLFYCTDCGDSICAEPENLCNCPVDCLIEASKMIPPKDDILLFLNYSEQRLLSELSQEIERRPELLEHWQAQGNINAFEYLYIYEPGVFLNYLDYVESKNRALTSTNDSSASRYQRPELINVSSKQDAIVILQEITGEPLREDMTTLVDIGDWVWLACTEYGVASERKRTCCQMPYMYMSDETLNCTTTNI